MYVVLIRLIQYASTCEYLVLDARNQVMVKDHRVSKLKCELINSRELRGHNISLPDHLLSASPAKSDKCKTIGGKCSKKSDCCGGRSCIKGVCRAKGCKQRDQRCHRHSDCCSNKCLGLSYPLKWCS